MNWPWVSRLAYDTAIDERDRLRTKNDELVDQIIRIKRREQNMPEVGPKPDHRKGQEPIPGYVDKMIKEAWASPHSQLTARQRAMQLYREKKNWDDAAEALEAEIREALA